MIKKSIIAALLILVLLSTYFFMRSDLNRIYLPTASGIVAKQVCSLHFVSGFSMERARELYLDPLAGDFAGFIFSSINTSERETYASVLGLYRQTAVYREGIGCSLVHDGRDFDRDIKLPSRADYQPLPIDQALKISSFDTLALNAALDANFGGSRNTLAIAVLYKGRLVAEKYADSITSATPLHGWSLAKSLTTTLAGHMIKNDEIGLDQKAVMENPRLENLTLRHLLGMTSGLHLTETGDGWDPNSRMLFTQSDMADWASEQEIRYPPNRVWEYMSGNTVLAMRALQNRLGDSLDEQLIEVRKRILNPLEMHSTIIETDEAGTLQGSSYVYASAHDWARLGQLYLDSGIAANKQLLPENWLETVSTPFPGANEEYGLGFWRVNPAVESNVEGIYMGGFQGQFVFILPQHDLVIVRLGATNFRSAGGLKLMSDVIAALRTDSDDF